MTIEADSSDSDLHSSRSLHLKYLIRFEGITAFAVPKALYSVMLKQGPSFVLPDHNSCRNANKPVTNSGQSLLRKGQTCLLVSEAVFTITSICFSASSGLMICI